MAEYYDFSGFACWVVFLGGWSCRRYAGGLFLVRHVVNMLLM